MISLRRATARFLSSRPSASLSISTRSFNSFRVPLATFPNQAKPACVLQRRFASEEAVSKSDPEAEAEPKQESPVESERSATPSSEIEVGVELTQESFEHEEASVSSSTPDQPVEPKSFVTSASDAISNAASSAVETASSAAETVSGAASTIAGTAQDSESESEEPLSPHTTLYVGNIFWDTTEEDLLEAFQKAGPVKRVKLVMNSRGLSKGFAYIDYETVEDADNAISKYNQQLLQGRRLNVQKSLRTTFPKPIVRTRNAPSKTLFMGNVPYNISDRDLNNYFRDIKDVVDVRVAIDRRTGQPRGFAHAEFTDVESAIQAYETLQGRQLAGRHMRLDYTAGSGRAVMREGEAQARPRSEGSDRY